MSNMINVGIDLGTTNSLIAKFNKGSVEVFQNPSSQGVEVLPSVVGFRNDAILVGAKARTYLEREPKNVVGRFKRRMGTTETFRIHSLGQSKSPVELSAFVLKELKTFIHTGETPEAVVITIPSSFDTRQSNATEQAGYAAGFKQVVLLQEPIAASLAYANNEKNLDLKNSDWIVYDLGGGTFDVALVRIVEGELKVVDHEGDNYLGGLDFDALIVEKLIAPQLEQRGQFTDLVPQMKSDSGRYNRLWYRLLHRAEEAKIELSSKSSAEIEFTVEDDADETIDGFITITRSEFETVIKDAVDSTADMLKKILTRNSLRPQELKFVLMVGGSTYIPFVRKRVGELLGIPINTGINPTNAIVVGAAYFAATREIKLGEQPSQKPLLAGTLRIKASYNRITQEQEEMFAAKVEGTTDGLFYRITREDGAYDSGLKNLTARIDEDLPIQENSFNVFAFKIYDSHNNLVPTDFDAIQITHGYGTGGQMLPEDLSLVLDDPNGNQTLELLFARNTVLPARRRITREASKPLFRGTEDEIQIIVVEGPTQNHFTANKTVGNLVIPAKHQKRDVMRGTDIDLEFEMSESRELKVKACVTSFGQEYGDVFRPGFREVRAKTLRGEVELLKSRVEQEKAEAISNENYEAAQQLEKLRVPIQGLYAEVMQLASYKDDDDVTDDRYKLDDRKRKLAQELDQMTAGKQLDRLRSEYETAKDETADIVNESGNDSERRQLNEVISQELTFVNSPNPQKLQERIAQLRRIGFGILRRTPDFQIGWFEHLKSKPEVFNDPLQAKNLIEAGKRHIVAEDYDRLEEVNLLLHRLLPEKDQDSDELRPFSVGLRG